MPVILSLLNDSSFAWKYCSVRFWCSIALETYFWSGLSTTGANGSMENDEAISDEHEECRSLPNHSPSENYEQGYWLRSCAFALEESLVVSIWTRTRFSLYFLKLGGIYIGSYCSASSSSSQRSTPRGLRRLFSGTYLTWLSTFGRTSCCPVYFAY